VLYNHLVEKVFFFVISRSSDKDVAKEVTQDVFIELHRSLKKFTYHSDEAFYAFVYTIARRQLIKRYKDSNKHASSELEESFHGTPAPVETEYAIWSALATLDECSREIVVLHHWSRFTFAEIGKIINMTEGAVRVRHHRARAALASLLTP
jgi:RNA polymerase sigma-70 factor (ECF subfamily)